MSYKRLTAFAAALGTVLGLAAQAGLRSDSLDALARQAWESSQQPLFADTTAMAQARNSMAQTVRMQDYDTRLRLDRAMPYTPLEALNPYNELPTHCSNPSPYALPYSLTGTSYDWRRLWINTGVLTGAFVGTLLVLECLPEDATSWNRAELQNVPLFKRWKQHVFDQGCEWDHDKFVFNYVLHPYAGAVYFMGARSVGFNFYQSMLYAAIISNIGWEFGIEAFMERPSYQDLFITPLVGSAIGEGFYMLKRHIVDNGYELGGSQVLGNIVAFLIDPVNEVIGIFDHNPARVFSRAKAWDARHAQRAQVSFNAGLQGLSLRVVF